MKRIFCPNCGLISYAMLRGRDSDGKFICHCPSCGSKEVEFKEYTNETD